MMKTVKKLLALALCAALVAAALPAAASEGGYVSLRVEGVNQTVIYESKLDYSGENVLDLLLAVLNDKQIDYVADGGYLSKIGDDEAGTFGGWDGWVYYVNETEGTAAMNECTLKNGDEVLIVYADPYGEIPTLWPRVSAEKGEEGAVTLTFTAELTTFDADWNPTVSTIAVADALVTVDGKAYTTDENGAVILDTASSSKVRVSLQIEKFDENGKPLVVRFAPGFELALPGGEITFSDVSENSWYKEYVVQLVRLGAINGYSDGTFRPTAATTRAEFIKILACLDPEFDSNKITFVNAFSDVRRGDWFMPYVMWALDKGVIESASVFNPSTSLAREDMALYSYNMAVKVLAKKLPATEAANAFADDAQISERCKEAVYLLQKAGIINGIANGDAFVYAPLSSTQRSQAAKVVTLIYNLADTQ